MRPCFGRRRAAPKSARLTASVAGPVDEISVRSAPGAGAAERLGRQVASGVERGPGGASFGMRARGIAVWDVAKDLADFGEQRRRTGVVEGDAASPRCGQA